MEEQAPKNKNFVLIPVVIAGVLVLAIAGFFAFRPNQGTQVTSEASMVTETPTELPGSEVSGYKDGTYKVTGNYVSPGGPREIDVTLTLEEGVVTASEFVGKATDATSKRFQGEFAQGYEAQVVGKNLDEIAITKVAGSSLTPKGFMDAVEKIKVEATEV